MGTTALGLSEKQVAMRMEGIGASEVFAVLNNPISIYERKLGLAPDFEGNSLTEFGHRIERTIGEAWADRHAAEGVRVYTPGTLRHPRFPWAMASPDRVVAPAGQGRPAKQDWKSLLEIKTVFFSGSDYTEDEIPERHLVQVQWQLEVADMQKATLVALVNGDYREYPVERDRETGELLLEVVGKFWRENVLAKVPPPIDGSPEFAAYLRRRHPRAAAPPLQADEGLRNMVANYREVKAELALAEEREQLVSNMLRASIGDADGIEGLCTYRQNKDGTKTDWEGFATACNRPDLLPQFTTTKPGARVLRLSKEK
jgi:putative phage-type endonuclease